jgi:hypothetical protein
MRMGRDSKEKSQSWLSPWFLSIVPQIFNIVKRVRKHFPQLDMPLTNRIYFQNPRILQFIAIIWESDTPQITWRKIFSFDLKHNDDIIINKFNPSILKIEKKNLFRSQFFWYSKYNETCTAALCYRFFGYFISLTIQKQAMHQPNIPLWCERYKRKESCNKKYQAYSVWMTCKASRVWDHFWRNWREKIYNKQIRTLPGMFSHRDYPN